MSKIKTQPFLIKMEFLCEIEAKSLEVALKKAEDKELGKIFKVRKKKIYKYKSDDIIKIAEYDPREVLCNFSGKDYYQEYKVGEKTYSVRINSKYFVFKENPNCVVCGLKGKKMILEESVFNKSFHFNLYGEENNQLILITKDHIKPRKSGGRNIFSNYQSMCSVCNQLKGSSSLCIEDIKVLRELYNKNIDLNKKDRSVLLKEARSSMEATKFHKQELNPGDYYNNTDINIWRTPEGFLKGTTIYNCRMEGINVASLSERTKLDVLEMKNIAKVKFNDNETFYLNKEFIGTVQ